MIISMAHNKNTGWSTCACKKYEKTMVQNKKIKNKLLDRALEERREMGNRAMRDGGNSSRRR